MARTWRIIRCTPEELSAVVADGWLYPVWVVGASRMRDVDDGWPAPGRRLHHSFGVWPALIDDTTEALEWRPQARLRLRARGWPVGEAEVTIDVRAHAQGCLVRITEKAVRGPGAWLPAFLLDAPLHIRNRETLRRLAFLAEGHAARARAGTAERP